MDTQKILEGYLNEMQDAHKEFYAAKTGLLDVVLLPFETLFMKDTNGESLTKKMKAKDIRKLFGFTHLINGKYRNMSGYCFKCLTPLKPDYIKYENYCLDC